MMDKRLVEAYRKRHLSIKEAPAPTYSNARTKLGLVMRHPDARKFIYDLEHNSGLSSQSRSFLSLVQLVHMTGSQWNVNVQSGIKDLMKLLGYTDVDKLLSDVGMSDNNSKMKLGGYLKQINPIS